MDPDTEIGTSHFSLARHHTVVEREPDLYLRLDAEGRWVTFGSGALIYRRSIDGRVLRHDGKTFTPLVVEADRRVL